MNKEKLLEMYSTLSKNLCDHLLSEFSYSDETDQEFIDAHEQRVEEFKSVLYGFHKYF